MSKPVHIAFTGGCHSGKTTSIQTIKKILEKAGKKVFIFSEIIRNHNIGTIDEIRKDANKYMDLQHSIINEKIDMENCFINSYSEAYNRLNTVVLIDRAITDSLFYLTFYTNKNEFNNESYDKFIYTLNNIYKHLDNIDNVYNYVFEFKPLNKIQENDVYRPSNLEQMKDIEYKMIHEYNKLYLPKHLQYIDLNNVPMDMMEQYWENYIKENTEIVL